MYEQNGQADVQKDDHTDHDCVRTLGKKEDDNQYKDFKSEKHMHHFQTEELCRQAGIGMESHI